MDRDIEQAGDHGETYREHRDTAAPAGQVPPAAVEAALATLLDEDWSPPHSASIRDCPEPGALKVADEAADRANRESVTRILAAAGQVTEEQALLDLAADVGVTVHRAAAAGQVPAEAVEAAMQAYGRVATQGAPWTRCLEAALAAAAPLIVADRIAHDRRVIRATIEVHRGHRGSAAVCIDQILTEIDSRIWAGEDNGRDSERKDTAEEIAAAIEATDPFSTWTVTDPETELAKIYIPVVLAAGIARRLGGPAVTPREHRDTAAVAGQVPAEAVEAMARAVYERERDPIPWEPQLDVVKEPYREQARFALAAAAPLIAAAWQESTPVVVAALDEASHTIANLRADVDRLTAERNAALARPVTAMPATVAALYEATYTEARLTKERDALAAEIDRLPQRHEFEQVDPAVGWMENKTDPQTWCSCGRVRDSKVHRTSRVIRALADGTPGGPR